MQYIASHTYYFAWKSSCARIWTSWISPILIHTSINPSSTLSTHPFHHAIWFHPSIYPSQFAIPLLLIHPLPPLFHASILFLHSFTHSSSSSTPLDVQSYRLAWRDAGWCLHKQHAAATVASGWALLHLSPCAHVGPENNWDYRLKILLRQSNDPIR